MLRRYYKDSFKAQEKLKDIRKLVRILEVSDANIEHALSLRWKDFEDAVQYAVAVDNNLDVIVTRNVKDFELKEIPVLTPLELLEKFRVTKVLGGLAENQADQPGEPKIEGH